MPVMALTYRPSFYLRYSKESLVDYTVYTQPRMEPFAIELPGAFIDFVPFYY